MKKLKVATESTLTAEERAAMMGSLLNEEETRQEEIEQELKQLRDMQFRKAEEMYASKRDEKNTEAEIQVRYMSPLSS